MTTRSELTFPMARLLAEPAGASRRYELRDITIPLDEELVEATPISGEFGVARTNRGLLVDGTLTTVLATECSRCLEPARVELTARLSEEVLPSIDVTTGQALDRTVEPDVVRLSDHHELDLEPLLREAILLAAPIAPLCGPDCPGLCIECGERLGAGHRAHDADDIDPRLVALRSFRVDGDAENG
ncbi:MAG: DUF177 domain-containing protein [Chloroflexi bacterium]|nr:DUF177 domain-containing protein [Chloroflexota bacterium]